MLYLKCRHNPFDDVDGRGNSVDPEELFREAKKTRHNSMIARTGTGWFTYIHSFDDYSIVDFVGRGTFGEVYSAVSKTSGAYIAIKCLDKDALIQGKQLHFVKREVAALQLMNHPFVVKFYNVISSARKLFLAMEYIPGIELWTYMLKYAGNGPYGGIPIDQAIIYTSTILLALEHVHSQGYIYRDLKVKNIQ